MFESVRLRSWYPSAPPVSPWSRQRAFRAVQPIYPTPEGVHQEAREEEDGQSPNLPGADRSAGYDPRDAMAWFMCAA